MNETLRPLNGPPGLIDPVDPSLYADALYAERRRLLQERKWRPIDTAPKDGTPFLAYQPEQTSPYPLPVMMMVMEWEGSFNQSLSPAWVTGYEWEWGLTKPSHWMPLPSPPLPETEGKP